MKKVICLLLVLAMAIGMVGCSNNAGNNNSNGGSSDEVYEVVLKFPTMMTIPTPPVMAMDSAMAASVPRCARASCFAPMFWLTKVVAAMAVDCMGSMMNWSSLL